MTVTVEKPKIITLLYRQEKSDPDYGSCLWARFYLDTQNYTMSIESDCGNYSHGWYPTPDSESFLHLLCRMDYGYLRDKLAERTIVDGAATWNCLKGMIECEAVELEDDVWQELEAACYHQRNADAHDHALLIACPSTKENDAQEEQSQKYFHVWPPLSVAAQRPKS